ncbi:FV3-083R, partial [Symbiodinium sp. KB8]
MATIYVDSRRRVSGSDSNFAFELPETLHMQSSAKMAVYKVRIADAFKSTDRGRNLYWQDQALGTLNSAQLPVGAWAAAPAPEPVHLTPAQMRMGKGTMMSLERRNEPQMLRSFWKNYPSYRVQPLLQKRYHELLEARAFNEWLENRRIRKEGEEYTDTVGRLTDAVNRRVPQLRYAPAARAGVQPETSR